MYGKCVCDEVEKRELLDLFIVGTRSKDLRE